MRSILIDDEPLALQHLKKLLTNIGGVKVEGTYSHPHEGLEAINKIMPDVVFLDIDMPGLSGIEMAELIQNTCPSVQIIFITAYNEYAVKAFELNALDYVMKPIRKQRLEETVKRLAETKRPSPETKEESNQARISLFGTLKFYKGEEMIPVRWRTTKAKEMLAYFIHHRQSPIRKEALIDLFWPEVEPAKGSAQLYAAVYQIRKTLAATGFDIRIKSHNQSYMIEMQEISLDVELFEEKLQEVTREKNQNLMFLERLLNLYTGGYLEQEGYVWAEGERERLRILWIEHAQETAAMMVDIEDYAKGLLMYHRILELNPFSEEAYFSLMELYGLQGEYHSVELQYRKLEEMMLNEYGTRPSQAAERWYRNWKKSRS